MPNVLDENVVILKFDNSDFKKNTADSVKSIENLKSSLKNADAGETISKIGHAANSIDLSGLGKAVDNVNKRFSLMGIVGMSAINKLTTSAMSSAARIAKAIPKQMIQGGWKRALNIEQAEFLMEGLGHKFEGTYDKATKEFSGIKGAVLAAVDSTRYGLDEAAKIAAQLMASGITGEKELASRLKSISGLASVVNADFSDIGRIFAQVAGQGRMMGDDLLQISQRGVNAAAKISEYLNANGKVKQQALDNAIAQGKQVKKMEEISKHAKITEGDVRDMVSAGAISFDVMASSFEDFFEQAQKANNTYEGSFANVKAALSRMGAQLEAPKLENMTRIFNTLLPILNKFEDFISPFTTKIAKASNKVTDFINEGILNPIGEAIGVKPDKMFHGIAQEIKNAGDESKKAGKETENLKGKIQVTTKEWKAALDIWNKGTYGTGQKRADAIRKLGMSYENVQGIINRFYKSDYDWSKTKKHYDVVSKDKAKESKDNAKATAEETDRLHEQTEQLSVLGKIIRGVINFIKAFTNTLKALKAIASAVWKQIKGMTSTLTGGLMSIFLKISEVVLKLSENFLTLGKVLNGELKLKDVKKDFPELHSILTKLKSPVETIAGAFRKLKEQFGEMKNTVSSSGVFGKLKDAFSKLGKTVFNGLVAAFDKLQNVFGKFTSNFKGGKIGSVIGSVFVKILEGVTNFINALAGGEKVAGSFFSFLGGMANKIIGIFAPLANWLADHFFGIIEKSIELFKKIGQSEGFISLKQSIKDLADALFKAAQPMDNVVYGMEKISGAANGGGNLDKVVNFFSNLAKGLSNLVNSVMQGKNPLETFIGVFKKVKDSFSLGGIVDYIKSTLGFKTGKGLNFAFNAIIDTFSSFKNWLVEIGAFDKVIAVAKAALGGIDTIVKWIKGFDFDAILNKIVNAPWEKISKVALSFAGVFAMIKTARDMGKVASSAAGMFDSIGGMFKSFGSIADTIKTSIKMKSFETLALAVSILIGSIVALAMVPAKRLKPALYAITVILAALTGIMLAMNSSKFDPAKLHAIGIAFAGVGAGILLIATSMQLIARLNGDELLKAGVTIGAFMVMIAIISTRAKEMAGTGAAFMGLAVAINLLVTAILAFALMPVGVLLHGGAAILGFMVAMSLAARIAKSSNPGGFVAMAIALNLLIPSIIIMAMLPANMILRGGAAIVGLMLALASAARIANGKGFGDMGKVALTIGVLAAACLVLSFISPDRLLPAAAAISAMMISLGKAATAANKNSKALLSMSLMIGVVAGSIIALEKIAPERAVKIALSLSAVFAALGLAMGGFSKLGGGIKAAASAGIGMSVMILEIVGVVTLIVSAFSGIRKAIDKLAGEGSGEKVFKYLGDTMGLIGEAIGKFAGGFVGGFANMSGLSGTLDSLKEFISGISDLASAASGFDKEELSNLKSFASSINELGSADLKSAIAKFLGGGEMDISAQVESFTGSLVKLVEGIKELSDEDIKRAKLAADIFGVFAHGAHEMPATGGLTLLGSTKSLEDFATQMTDFGEKMPEFISAMDGVPLEKLRAFMHVDNDGNIAKDSKLGLILQLLSALSHADIPTVSLKGEVWSGVKSLSGFGEEMTGFGESMNTFIDEMNGVPLEQLSAFMKIDSKGNIAKDSKLGLILNLIKALNQLQGGLEASGGIEQAIHGNTTLAEFGQNLAGVNGFGRNMQMFISQISEGIDEEQLNDTVNKIGPIASVIKTLSEAGEEIPESGGVKQFLLGTQDLGTFGAQIAQFAIGFKSLYDQFLEVPIDESNSEAFMSKIKTIASASKTLNGIDPPSTSFFDAVSLWAQQKLSNAGISSMVKTIKKVGESEVPDNIDTVASNIANASDSLSKIKPPSSGFFDALSNWAATKVDSSAISNLVSTLNTVSEKGKTVDIYGISKFSNAITSVKGSVSKIKELGTIPTGGNLVNLANNISKYVKKINKLDTADLGSKVTDVASSAKTIASTTSSQASKIAESSGSFKEAGSTLSSSLAKGLGSTKSVVSAARKLVTAAKDAINKNALVEPGKQLSAGLASGMRDALSQVKSAAEELEKQAERAVKAKAKIESPSKVFMKLGGYIGSGFAIGIESYSNKVYRAGNKMAQRSVDAANDAMAGLDTFSSPVITPVLDLSEVERGAGQINSIMSSTDAMRINANMNGVVSNYATSTMVRDLLDKFDNMTAESLSVKVANDGGVGNNIVNNITVDGAENPEAFANRFIRQLELEMRTT